MRRSIAVCTAVTALAAAMAASPAEAEANHRNKVLCGNFSGQGPDPRLARRPARCNVLVNFRDVVKLRSMEWTRWSKRARGRGLVDGRQSTVRLRRRRPCGRNGQYKVYSQMSINGGAFRRILHCGD